MTTDQPAADRERIAGEMCKAQPGRWWIADEFHELGNAVRAFETLCEPRGFMLCRENTDFDGTCSWMARAKLNSDHAWGSTQGGKIMATSTRDHAADVCRLICEVLDREAKEEGR